MINVFPIEQAINNSQSFTNKKIAEINNLIEQESIKGGSMISISDSELIKETTERFGCVECTLTDVGEQILRLYTTSGYICELFTGELEISWLPT